LEELKAKDHQLALLDRSQYPDRGLTVKPMPAADCSLTSDQVAVTTLKRAVDSLQVNKPLWWLFVIQPGKTRASTASF